MNGKQDQRTLDEKVFGKLLVYIGILLPLSIGLIVFVFFEYGQLSAGQIGQVGDFFGGWLTPVILAFTLLLLIFTIRFQIHQLKVTRDELKASAEAQKKAAQAHTAMLKYSKRSFELDSNAKGLVNLVAQSDDFLNTKVNLYIDIINFDNKLPDDIRLFNVLDIWRKEIESGNKMQMKCRNDRDKQHIDKYLQSLNNEIYVCQSLVKNDGWVYLSPYLNSISEHIEASVILYKVGLISDKTIWRIKQALNGLHNKVSHINSQGVVLDDEIIAKMVKEIFKELLMSIPTPEMFRYSDQPKPVVPAKPEVEAENTDLEFISSIQPPDPKSKS
ncbi:hypothetical protein [Psychrosphaera algicola]|uniref:Phage abortive infection protein n=1 Tax=Psychrosphaera algicola TaxID=3023714 RepID=A0ABT5FJD6_9GAMM|nr:hypothetical protein [Psychrosphaera sp. G1-22]MDC2891307.1 hypothetical protein [Psychrosphaera sp. G1-22]